MKYIFLSLLLSLLLGCAAKTLEPGAQSVMITTTPPSKNCRFLGEVDGSQGNWFTADITSDKSMIQGARNEMRNQAYAMGANYIVIVNQSTSENSSGFGGAYNASMFGNAFKFP